MVKIGQGPFLFEFATLRRRVWALFDARSASLSNFCSSGSATWAAQ